MVNATDNTPGYDAHYKINVSMAMSLLVKSIKSASTNGYWSGGESVYYVNV